MEFAEHLWRVISKISEDDLSFSERLEEFFTAAFAIFDFLCQSESTVLDFDGLYEKWVSQLCSHQLSETVGRPTEDQVVKGYTRLLRYCVHFGSQRGVKFDTTKARAIWAKLLYPVSQETKESIPVLHDDNRSELYNLLLEMSNTHEEKMNLIKLNNELFHDGKLVAEWFIDLSKSDCAAQKPHLSPAILRNANDGSLAQLGSGGLSIYPTHVT